MAEDSLLPCLNLELPAQIDNSIEQKFLLYEKETIYPMVLLINIIDDHEESQQNSEETEWYKTLVGVARDWKTQTVER